MPRHASGPRHIRQITGEEDWHLGSPPHTLTTMMLARARVLRSSVAIAVACVALAIGCGGAPKQGVQLAGLPTDAPLGPHTESTFKAADGLTLYEQSWRPTGTPRMRVVLVHGLKDHGSRYADLAARLVRRGFSVHAMDLRGHGRSEGERVWVDAFDEYVSDLAAYLALLDKREPTARAVLFGHSMGGAIASLYVLQRKPEPAGLVLSGAALKASVSGFKIFGTKVVASVAPRAAVFQLDPADFSRDQSVVAAMKSDPLIYQGAAAANTARVLLGAMKPIEDGLERFELPLLILHGEKDTVTDPDGSRELYRRARAADKKLAIYTNALHDILHEPEREQVMTDIETFVEHVSLGAGNASRPSIGKAD
jgi:alpha-beta hydrolase superfamily lysophospholipase